MPDSGYPATAKFASDAGKPGSRGSAEPLEACDVEFLSGIFDLQVCAALTLHVPYTLCALRRTHALDLAVLTA